MSAAPVVHYMLSEDAEHAACGRDVLGLSRSPDPLKVTCRLCAEHRDVRCARLQRAEKQLFRERRA